VSLWDNFTNVIDGVEDVTTRGLEIVGSAVAGALEEVPGGRQFFEAYGTATRDISRVATQGISALPGGISTLSIEEARQISPGQAAAANVAANIGGFVRGGARIGTRVVGEIAEDVTGRQFDPALAERLVEEQIE